MGKPVKQVSDYLVVLSQKCQHGGAVAILIIRRTTVECLKAQRKHGRMNY